MGFLLEMTFKSLSLFKLHSYFSAQRVGLNKKHSLKNDHKAILLRHVKTIEIPHAAGGCIHVQDVRWHERSRRVVDSFMISSDVAQQPLDGLLWIFVQTFKVPRG